MTSAIYAPNRGAFSDTKKGLLRRAYDGMVKARERRVQLQINAHLLGMDDKTLVSLGYSRSEIERQGTHAVPLF